jgi:hypothetical protein
VTWDDGFTSLPKEGLLDFIAIKNLLPSAGFEPSYLGSNDKHASHCVNGVTKL